MCVHKCVATPTHAHCITSDISSHKEGGMECGRERSEITQIHIVRHTVTHMIKNDWNTMNFLFEWLFLKL